MAIDIIELAEKQVGLREEPRGSNRGPWVDVYTGGNAVPWCALFVCYLFRTAGKPIPTDYAPSPGKMSMTCNVGKLEDIFRGHDWLVRQPQPGDVVFYHGRGRSDSGPGRHTGLVVGVEGYDMTTIEGNWGDKVAKRRLRWDSPEVASFGRMP